MKNNIITIIFIIAVVVQIITMILMKKYDWAFLIVLESSWGFTLGWLESEIHNSNHIKKLIKENIEFMCYNMEMMDIVKEEKEKETRNRQPEGFCAVDEIIKEEEAADD